MIPVNICGNLEGVEKVLLPVSRMSVEIAHHLKWYDKFFKRY
jgi:hypothetical protein